MDEKVVERMLRQRIEDMIPGAKCLKFVSPGYSGVPDRLILLPGGRTVFAETKRPGEYPRQRQLFVQSQIRKLGFVVAGCVDSPEAVNEVVRLCVAIAAEARMSGSRRRGKREDVATRDSEPAKGGDA